MISSKVWIPTGYNFNSAMVLSFKFLVIISYQTLCICKTNHFIRNNKGKRLKNADCAIDCIMISVEKWGESEQVLDIFSNFAMIKVSIIKVSD